MSAENLVAHQFGPIASQRPIRLHNETCVYCNAALSPETKTKEHVVGRRFVPKGKLDSQWNLVVNACRPCNGKKSDLEDDISAITLQPDAAGRHAHNDLDAAAEACRKGQNSISRRTKKAVAQSREHITMTMPFGDAATFTFKFVSPPQIDQHRAFELARMQLVAFFYLITYNIEAKRGYYWTGLFCPVMVANRADWGNPIMKSFAEAVADWEPRVCGQNADGFFKVLIKRHPAAACWSWALEWNHMTRLIGFFGDKEAALQVANAFPPLEKQTAVSSPRETIRYREETPLSAADDRLFYYNDAALAS